MSAEVESAPAPIAAGTEHEPAAVAGQASVPEQLATIATRLEEVEDSIAELTERIEKEFSKLRRSIDGMDKTIAKKKQLKKIIKVLDQLEVIEDEADEKSEH